MHQSLAQRREVYLLGVPRVGRRDDIDEGERVYVKLFVHGEVFVGDIDGFQLVMDGRRYVPNAPCNSPMTVAMKGYYHSCKNVGNRE